MPVTALLRRRSIEIGWVLFGALNIAAMIGWPAWETIPFHFIWVSLTLLYGFRVWGIVATSAVLAAVVLGTGSLILIDAFQGSQLWGELFEVPLMSAMFLAMVWHARRRQQAMRALRRQTRQLSSLLERQEGFLHDASHELRTPVTIARGHLEILRRRARADDPEIAVALDELTRIEHLLDRLLLLARAEQPDFLQAEDIEVEAFLEDIFMRWSEVARRAWQLGELVSGKLRADREAMRIALDALLENAVKYTDEGDTIVLGARARGDHVVIDVADGGSGVPPEALGRIFDRFARADPARSRTAGGVGLGLAIVDTIAKAHGGRCTVRSDSQGSTFSLRVPGFAAAPGEEEVVAAASSPPAHAV